MKNMLWMLLPSCASLWCLMHFRKFIFHPLSYYRSCPHLCHLMSTNSHNVIAIKLREHTHTATKNKKKKNLKNMTLLLLKTQHVLWPYCLLDYGGYYQCRNLYLSLLCSVFFPVKLMNGCCKTVCKNKSLSFLLREWHQNLLENDVSDC